MDAISSLIADKPLVIFSKKSCCMSYSIKSLIESFGANPVIYQLDDLPNRNEIESALVQPHGCQPSVPAVFIKQQLIGGAREIMSLNVKNELGPLLVSAGAIWLWKSNSRKSNSK